MAVSSQVDLANAQILTAPPLADWLVIAPLIFGFIFGALCLMQRKNVATQGYIAITGLTLMLLADIGLFWNVLENGAVVMTMGRWLPPFGITFEADLLGATFAFVAGIVGLASGVYALRDIDATGRRYGFYPFLLLMMSGVTSTFLTGDIFNLYVWFEVLLISSFGLLILGSERAQLDGATKYAFLNLIATTLFLIGVAYLYGLFGTLNMADIARKSEALNDVGPHFTVVILFLFAFLMKAAAFPLNAWLPASYHTPKVAASAVFAGLLTKVGVYALLRLFLTLFPSDRQDLALVIAIIAALTMVLGSLGALAQSDIRRTLGYLVISGIGMMLAGLALGSQIGVSGAVFYAMHSMIIMTALYMLFGIMGRAMGHFDLARAGGLYSAFPWLAGLALVLILAMSGLPPLSGLWPKLMLVKASIDVGIWWLAAAIITSGFLTTIALARVFSLAFWRPSKDEEIPENALEGQGIAISVTIALALITIIVGIYPEPVIQVMDRIAFELLDPQHYIDAVFTPQIQGAQ